MSRDVTTLSDRFGWSDPAMYYPAGTDRCQLCTETGPCVGAYPDVAHPPDPITVCLSCLARHHRDWSLFGETILEQVPGGHDVVELDPDHMVVVTFELPADPDWLGIPAPTYDPWDRLDLELTSSVGEMPASRSPWETRTVPTVDVDGADSRIVVDGHEFAYGSYHPVDESRIESRETEKLREPPGPDI